MNSHHPLLSVVVPCYNEQEVLPHSALRLKELLERLVQYGKIEPASQVIFVDDGSRDGTWPIIEDLHRRFECLCGLKLSRNCGHQNALMAGILAAPGDVVASMDADLQDDVDALELMIDAHAAGADVVLGVRRTRAADTAFKLLTAKAYYQCLRLLGVEIVPNHADYRLLSRRAVEALREYGELNLFLRALVVHLGFKTAIIGYDRGRRFAGELKYPMHKMIALALDGITSFSARPLRYITLLGFICSFVSFMLGGWALAAALIFKVTVPGWASTVVPIYLICGVQILCLGIIGEYIGKIYHEAKRRPRFHVETALLNGHSPLQKE